MKIYNIHSGHPKRESFSKFRLWIEKGMGGKTRVFGKNRVFSTKPGFPGRTSVLLANPGYFKGLEAQGIHIYNVTALFQSSESSLLRFCEDLLIPEGGYWGSSVVFGCHWQLYSICSGRYSCKKDMDVFEYPQPLRHLMPLKMSYLYQLLTCIAVIW